MSKNQIGWFFRAICVLIGGWTVSGGSGIVLAEDWPRWRGPQRNGEWQESGLYERFPAEGLTPTWTVPVGSGYSGPTVAAGRVYLTDRLTEPKPVERVHCFDEQTGAPLWSYSYDCPYVDVGYEAGPRAAVTVADGRAFALGAMGDLHVFEAASGKLIWHRPLKEHFQIAMPIWGISAAPLVHDNKVIVHIGGTPDACVVALDVMTGEELWRALKDRASYTAPIMIHQAGKEVLVVWTGDHIAGLDPATGTTYWLSPMPPSRMVIGVATPVFADDQLFVTSFYDGAKLLKIDPAATRITDLWHRRGENEQQTDAIHSIIGTPLLMDGYIYGVDSYGELRCLDARTGDRLWEDLTATPKARWSTIHMVRNGKTIWMFNEMGELIIGRLSPERFTEVSRTKIIEPTTDQLNRRGQGVCWAHPAYANRHILVRSDRELRRLSLAAPQP